MNQLEQIARVERMQEETRKFCAEQHEATPLVWPFAIGGMIAGAAIFAAGAASVRLFGA